MEQHIACVHVDQVAALSARMRRSRVCCSGIEPPTTLKSSSAID